MICIREFLNEDAKEAAAIWNRVVEDGVAFPQLETLSEEEKQKLLPDREFCGNVYKYLRANNGFSFSEEILCYRLGLKEEKLASLKIALDMFIELGVINYENGRYLLPAESKKVELTESSIYKSLL